LHVPAHRQAAPRGGRFLEEVYRLDLTELTGTDDLHCPRAAIAAAQGLAARAWGADETFFLVNGTSGGLHAALLSVLSPGGKVALPRNIHRSVMAAVIWSGADPVWLDPVVVPEFGLTGWVEQHAVREALKEEPAAVLLVHPTYEGLAGDLRSLVAAVHAAGVPVIVDEAHGAHLRFHPALPSDAMACGADVAVQSTHKTGGALTQASMLHRQGGRVDAGRLRSALSLVQTTSPSFPLLASLDLARRDLVRDGRARLEDALTLADGLRARLASCPGLSVLGAGDLPGGCLDGTRVTVSVRDTGLSGYAVARALEERYRIRVEAASAETLLAVLGIGTRAGDVFALAEAMESLGGCKRLRGAPAPRPPRPPKRLAPREAWFAGGRRVALEEASGRVSAELIAVHPPGLVVVCPGEEMTAEVVAYLTVVRALGLAVHGASDATVTTVRVLD